MIETNVIIVEGCDKTGKTTLIQEMRERWEIDVIKKNNPKHDAYYEYMNDIHKLSKAKKPVVFDRFYFSELVYGPLMRGGNWIDVYKFDNIEKMLSQLKPIVIHAYDDPWVIKGRMKEDGEDYLAEGDVEVVLRLFESSMKRTKFPVFKYRVSDGYKLLDQIKLVSIKRDEF